MMMHEEEHEMNLGNDSHDDQANHTQALLSTIPQPLQSATPQPFQPQPQSYFSASHQQKSEPTANKRTTPQPQELPIRCFTISEMSVFDVLQHPVHVFDIAHKRMWWANRAAVQRLWHAPDLVTLLARDFASDMSEATERRLTDYLRRFQKKTQRGAGAQETHIRDQWTFYPENGKQKITVQMSFSPIYVVDDNDTAAGGDGDDGEPYMAFLCETDLGSLLQTPEDDEIHQASLRGVEMLRHLPVAVSQFDIQGHELMHQNPEAMDLFGGLEDLMILTTTQHKPAVTTTRSNTTSPMTTVAATMEEDEELKEHTIGLRDEHAEYDDVDFDEAVTNGRTIKSTSTCIANSNSDNDMTDERNAFLCRFVDRALGRNVLKAVQQGHDCQVEAEQYITRKKDSSSLAAASQSNIIPTAVACCWYAIKVRRARDPVTQQAVILYSARDITEVIQAKNAADQANAEKSQLLAVLAHEIRTPLHQVVGFIDLLLAGNNSNNDNNPHSCTNISAVASSSSSSSAASITTTTATTTTTNTTSVAPWGRLGKRSRPRREQLLASLQEQHQSNPSPSELASSLSTSSSTSALSLSEEQLEYVQCLQTSTVSLMSIINNVLDYTRLEAGQMEIEEIPFNPRGVCEGCMEVARSSAEKKGLSMHLHYHNNVPDPWEPPRAKARRGNSTAGATTSSLPQYILGDPNRIRQILLNLLSNAVKFTHRGSITLTIRSSTHSVALDGTVPQPQYRHHVLEFVVTDTGIGIHRDQMDRIFKNFTSTEAAMRTTREPGSTGLGLSICKTLAEAMNGSLTVKSRVNVGSEFTLRIPVRVNTALHVVAMEEDSDCASFLSTSTIAMNACAVRASETSSTTAPSLSQSHLHPKFLQEHGHQERQTQDGYSLRILLVEDNKVNQKMIKAMLSRANSLDQVTIFDNGQLAVDEIKRRTFMSPRGAPCYYDLVLMDVQMPILNGLDATRQLRSLWSMEDLTIIGLTASSQSAELHQYLEVGMNDCIGKPVRFHTLQSTVESVRQQRIEEEQQEYQFPQH